MLFCVLLFLLLPGALSGAERGARKVVRVAYQEFNRQMEVDENNKPVSGYAYDYIQTIGLYAGWEVRFVPCDSFFDSIEKLRAGEADLIYEISHTEERAQEMLYPDEPMGFEYYYLYASADNEAITPDDYETLRGRTVGVTMGTTLGEILKAWCEKKGVELNVVEYEDIPEKEADLYAGKIDLDLELSMLAKNNLSAIVKIGSSPYYLVARKDRPDLVTDINEATDKIQNNDLFFFSRLQAQYFSDTVLSRNLTTDEKEWLAEHKTLRIGFFNHYLPFSSKDENGNPIGSAIEAVGEIFKRLDLHGTVQIEFICFDDLKKGYKAVESGAIDVMLPAYISGSVKQDYHIIGGKSIATLVSDLTFLNDYEDGKAKRVGVNRHNLMQYYYSKDSAPESEIVFFEDINGCLDGLLAGTADVTFLNGARAEPLLKPEKYHPLRSVRAQKDFQLRMAFAEDNIGLMLLMDRGLTMLTPDFINKASYAFVGRIYAFSLMDFIREHFLAVLAGVAFLVAMAVLLVFSRISNRKLEHINEALVAYSETIEDQSLHEADLRKQLEKKQDQLEDALQMAQSASRAKTTFLSNMSHDIRTPMNAIIGFTGLAASHVNEPEHVLEYLTTIAQSSEHLLSLINDVLDMSRIESGKMTLNEKPESLAGIFHALRDIARPDIKVHQLQFFIDTVDVRNEMVWCDKMRLNQVLFNLVSNAIKYTHPGGTITLRIEQKAATGADRARYEFRCKDNGIGMSEEFVKTIFDPFTREESSTVSGIQGTGLGMAIAKNIVEMMGGQISVTSKKGEGTEFVVVVEFRIAGSPAADATIPELKGLRSLVVDDDANACQGVADMLRAVGMRSEWCLSGQEAVSRTEEAVRNGDRFKVYVVDWLMPELDGIETVRRIRKIAGADAIIIILTAADWVDIEAEARAAGVTGFIAKPLFPSDLRRSLLQACGRSGPEGGAHEEAENSLKGRKVLLVDDSKLNRKIGMLQLQEHGMVVDTAENGQAAVDIIREKGAGAYDFILMDVQMPVMDGYEATARLRKLPDGGKVKIIAFSANAFEEDREKSLKAGMDGHIAKPLKIDELLKELKRFAG